MICFSPAKINLGLNILDKREDGFHNIDSVFYPVPLYDVLEILPAKKFKLKTFGIKIPGSQSNNILLEANRMMKKKYDISPIEISLLKNIPPGSGLGGGSSDAACFVKMVSEIFELKIQKEQLKNIVAELGSDCPFFIEASPALIGGRGENVKPIQLSLKGKTIVLVFPDIHISTKEAFKNILPNPASNKSDKSISEPIENWKHVLVNAFENPVFTIHPDLKEIKEKLYDLGAFYASMTGSGSAIYGLFESTPESFELLMPYSFRIAIL